MVNILQLISLLYMTQRILWEVSCPSGSIKYPIVWGTDFDDKWYAKMPTSNRYITSLIDDVILVEPDTLYSNFKNQLKLKLPIKMQFKIVIITI